MSAARIITETMEEGAAFLRRVEPRFVPVLDESLPIRLRPEGFAALLWIITGQQVSTASAAAIFGRLEKAGLTVSEAVAAAGEDDLRTCGLSRPKVRYAKALAESGLDYAALRGLSTHEVIATLTALPGIGRWSAEIYAMFSLGHADVMAGGDLALQESARLLFNLPERPSERALREMAEPWTPWRSVAAQALWVYYRRARGREGIGVW